LHVFDFNQRAISCYEKCGFRREGVLRDYWYKNGKFRDTLVMSILASEYQRESEKSVSHNLE
jgi:RimJ/RimL family protein N-acetyltransferase